ncbi:MAG: hypothetical protein RLZZ584_1004 [Pseudomonadota bacterium]|jgi:adenylate cyclase
MTDHREDHKEDRMGTEIERKFLVVGSNWRAHAGTHLSQGYLSRDKARTVRVRRAGERAFLTIKGAPVGITRPEFEYEIPLADAVQLLALCDGPLIEKIRRVVVHDGQRWEVDEFLGDNAGLVVAEIELRDADQTFSAPDWLGAEVTHDPRYINANIAVRPYCSWRDEPPA